MHAVLSKEEHMGESATLAPLTIPPDVEAFAAEKGAAAYLAGVVSLVRQIVPNHSIAVRVEDDPELAYNRTIVFTVEVHGWDAEMLAEADHRWATDIFKCCPAPLVHVFGLDVRHRE
jgi:hypothetical protein